MERIFIFLFLLLLLTSATFSQSVEWSFLSNRVNDTLFEVRLTASINEDGAFIYSQKQPQTTISQPTVVKFTKNPLVRLRGQVKEEGKLIMKHYDDLGYTTNIYKQQVTFVQTVLVKPRVKTTLTGSILFQTCNEYMCMPPETVPFSVSLN